jgi:hypothetical protein
LASALVLGGAAFSSGCSSAGSEPGAIKGDEAAGEIGLELSVGGVTLNSASYTITGPAGFSKTGTIDLSSSTALSATIGGIPVGTGYSITVTSTATDGATTCAGSATFNVTAHVTTPVTLHLVCHQPPHTGSVSVNGTVNICPVFDGISATPTEVMVGGAVALSAAAHDSDSGPSALVYHWSATSGSFSDAASASPSFTCLAPGLVTVTASVSDGDPAAGCADSATVQVKCSVPGAGSTAASTMAVYGDAPYGTTPTDTSQTVATPAFISSVNADAAVSLVLHVGDIHSGKQFCTQAYDQTVFDMWKSYQSPVVYTPGDNEWTDCNKAGEGGGLYNAVTQQIDFVKDSNGVPVDYANGDPVANLALIRSIFFPQAGMSLGVQKMPVLSQAQFNDPAHPADANYIENVMFEKSKVLFVTINLPGGSNNDDDAWYVAPTKSAAQIQEAADRTGANLRWLDAAFTQAQADGVVAVVIQAQADMWDNSGTVAHEALYEPFVQSMASHTTAFGKPVLLFSGDSHVYRSDNPLSAADPLNFMHPGYNVPNFHRVIVHGSTFPLEYLRVTVDPSLNAPVSDTAFGPFSWVRVMP